MEGLHRKYKIKVGTTLKLAGPKGFVSLVQVVWGRNEKPSSQSKFQLLEPRTTGSFRFKAVPLLQGRISLIE
jgi:hypothetical protein